MQVKPVETKQSQDVMRHQSMRKLALSWLAQTRSSQQKLVELVNRYWQAQGEPGFKCEHTLLSRMLHPSEPYVALAGRVKAMKIQEAIMVVCSGPSSPSVVETTPEPDEIWSSDEEHAFVAHRARLRSLRNREGLRPFQSLALVGELVANALGMDDTLPSNELGETLRQRAAENALLTLAVIVDGHDVTGSLARRIAQEDALSEDRAGQIQEAQIARVRKMMGGVKNPTVGMMAYAGVVLFQAGKRDTGFGLLIEAVRKSYDLAKRHDPHWETLLELLDRLEEQKAPDAGRFMEQAAALFEETLSDPEREKHRQLMMRAFAMVEAPCVNRALFSTSPKLAGRLYPNQVKARSGVGHAVMMMLLMVGALITGGVMVNHGPVRGDTQVAMTQEGATHTAVRGREAKSGPTNPPPPPSTDQQT